MHWSEMVQRSNSSHEAVTVFVFSQLPGCYRLRVYDWEADEGVGLIPVPVARTGLDGDREVGTSNTPTGSTEVRVCVCV